jgi:lipid-binding SYLF domain-containing protein
MLPTFKKAVALATVLAVTGIAAAALADSAAEDRAEAGELFAKARDSYNDLIKADSPDQGIPQEMLDHAKAIAVFPKVMNAAVGIGGRSGKGVVVVRQADGKWGAPAEFQIKGGSWGAQIGAQETELVLFFMSDKSVKSLIDSKFTLGAKAGVAAGPVGRSAEAATDLKLNSEIYSYAKSKGLFAGISLEGAKMTPDKEDNAHLYGKAMTTQEILFGGNVSPPSSADPFLSALP